MSDAPVDTTAPEAVATSTTTEQTTNNDVGEVAAPSDKEVATAEPEKQDVKDTTDESAKTEVKSDEKDGEATPPKEASSEEVKDEKPDEPYTKRENHSKYDPSILSKDDDPKKIIAQVWNISTFKLCV